MDRRDREEDVARDVRDTAKRADAESREQGGRGVDVDRVTSDADAGARALAPSSLRELYGRASRVELSRRRLLELLGISAVGAGALSLAELLSREYPAGPGGPPGNASNDSNGSVGGGPAGGTSTPDLGPGGDPTATPDSGSTDVVDLGDRGLEDGDDLTPFFQSAADGTTYLVPEGTYGLSSTTVSGDGYAFVGEPGARLDTGGSGYLELRGSGFRFEGFTVVNASEAARNDFQLNVTGTDWAVRNCAYEGKRRSDGFNLVTEVTERGKTGVVEGCYWPGVQPRSDTGWMWLNEGHVGNLLFSDCAFVQGGAYATKSTGPLVDGRVDFERCFFDSANVHNIRVGSTNRTCTVRDCVIVVDPERVLKRTDGIQNPRGIWAWYGSTRVVDTDIAQLTGAPAVTTVEGGGRGGQVLMVGGNLEGAVEGAVVVSPGVGKDPVRSAPDGVPTSPAAAVRRER